MSTAPDRPRRALAPWFLLASALGAAGWWALSRTGPEPAPQLPSPPAVEEPTSDVRPSDADPKVLFEQDVEPLLERSAARHRAAIERTVQLVDEEFGRYARGVDPFVRDLTSLRTRGKVLWRMGKELVGEEDEVRELVEETFGNHLFTEAELTEFLTLAIEHAAGEFEADRNKLLRDAREVVDGAGLPELALPGYEAFAAEVADELERYSQSMAEDSVWSGIGTLLVAEAAATAATALIVRTLPVVAAGAGGAAVAGGAGGGAGGSLAGPIGTGLGLVGGFVVGAIVDAWMTEGLEAELGERLDGLIGEIRAAVVEGDEQAPGLRLLLEAHARALEVAQRRVLEEAILRP